MREGRIFLKFVRERVRSLLVPERNGVAPASAPVCVVERSFLKFKSALLAVTISSAWSASVLNSTSECIILKIRPGAHCTIVIT